MTSPLFNSIRNLCCGFFSSASIYIFTFIAIGYSTVNAQNDDRKWQLNAGTHAVIYRYQNQELLQNMGEFGQANIGYPLSQISASRHIGAGFSPELLFSVNNVAKKPKTELTNTFFANGLAFMKYSLSNGYLLKTSSFLEPYLKLGIGMTYKEVPGNKFYTTRAFGGGLGIWPTSNRNIGIQLQALNDVVDEFPGKVENYFNYSAAVAYRFGHKDTDKDGIPDKKDQCPQDAGKKDLNGCPDNDEDGIPDKNDVCPDEKGKAEFEGCPDKDEDGIPDKDDECPNQKGPAVTKGCPDTDNDGIRDSEDSCKDKAGTAEFYGCPDFDGDNIPDHKDECPDTKGERQYNGCPDTDADNLPDNKDKCPMLSGPIENDGCPIEQPEEQDRGYEDKAREVFDKIDDDLAFSAKSIFFQSGKATILKESYSKLNEIAKLIANNPQAIFYIEGHTDNVGGEKFNLNLSKRRADAVKEYLIKKGVNGNRLISEGYGLKFPLVSNSTEEGKAQNRRVDISIKRD